MNNKNFFSIFNKCKNKNNLTEIKNCNDNIITVGR